MTSLPPFRALRRVCLVTLAFALLLASLLRFGGDAPITTPPSISLLPLPTFTISGGGTAGDAIEATGAPATIDVQRDVARNFVASLVTARAALSQTLPVCASSDASFAAMVAPELTAEAKLHGGIFGQAAELALNFGLKRLVHAGASALALAALLPAFPEAMRADFSGSLVSALADGPAIVLIGPLRAGKVHDQTLSRLAALFSSPHARTSAILIEGAAAYATGGFTLPSCIADPEACRPPWGDVLTAMCALAPEMNVDASGGIARIYPPVATGFTHKVPPRTIPASLWESYSMGGAAIVTPWYENEASKVTVGSSGLVLTANSIVVTWSSELIAKYEAIAQRRGESYYGPVDLRIYAMLDRHTIVSGRSVAIMGSLEPWYEVVAHTYGAKEVLTVEYGARVCADARFKIVTPTQFMAMQRRFDVAFVISSFEHDGLGRYGDPLDGTADLKVMAHMRDNVVAPGGYLILAMPTGPDAVMFNAHRVYGRKRLNLMFVGWELVDAVGFTEETPEMGHWGYQPVYLLRRPPAPGEVSVYPHAVHGPPIIIGATPPEGGSTTTIVGG